MKYMVMMFGEAATMLETRSKEWVTEMIGFMTALNEELASSGELVDARGLTDASSAKLVRRQPGGGTVVTDGPFAESKESLVGFWLLDVQSEERVLELAGRIVEYSGVVEVRPVADAPPEV